MPSCTLVSEISRFLERLANCLIRSGRGFTVHCNPVCNGYPPAETSMQGNRYGHFPHGSGADIVYVGFREYGLQQNIRNRQLVYFTVHMGIEIIEASTLKQDNHGEDRCAVMYFKRGTEGGRISHMNRSSEGNIRRQASSALGKLVDNYPSKSYSQFRQKAYHPSGKDSCFKARKKKINDKERTLGKIFSYPGEYTLSKSVTWHL